MNNHPMEKGKPAKTFRWRRLLAAVSLLLLLLLGGAYYAYDRMTDQLLEVLMDDAMASDSGAGEASGAAAQGLFPPLSADPGSAGERAPKSVEAPTADAGASGSEEAAGRGGTDGEDNQPVSADKKTTEKDGQLSPSYKPDISAEKAGRVKESVTMKEKLAIGSVILRHFSTDELSSFKEAASGGLTREEKKLLKEQAMSKLSAEEYDELIAIAKKYGLSKGKSYQESQQE